MTYPIILRVAITNGVQPISYEELFQHIRSDSEPQKNYRLRRVTGADRYHRSKMAVVVLSLPDYVPDVSRSFIPMSLILGI